MTWSESSTSSPHRLTKRAVSLFQVTRGSNCDSHMIPQGQFEDPPCRQEVTVTELLPSDPRDKHLDELFSHKHRRDEGCDACLTSWYDRKVSFLSIPLALPPVTRNYLLLLERKLWLSVRSLKPTFNEWQVHFFLKRGLIPPGSLRLGSWCPLQRETHHKHQRR